MTEEVKKEMPVIIQGHHDVQEFQRNLFKERVALLEKSIREVDQSVKQGLANLNMLEGSRQECMHWIKILETQAANGKA